MTSEHRLKTIYDDLFRVLEWYGMLPSDDARALIRPDDMSFYLGFVRRFGHEIAVQLKIDDRVEDDVERALGRYYPRFAASRAFPRAG